ncbi:MAG: hypothetical protein V3T70_00955 [Phycisphaerae bacterium]
MLTLIVGLIDVFVFSSFFFFNVGELLEGVIEFVNVLVVAFS